MLIAETAETQAVTPVQPPCLDSVDDAALLQRYCHDRDTAALEELFRRNATVAYHVALRCCGNVPDAEEAVQTAFCSILQHAQQYHNASGSVRGWMMSIVMNACRIKQREQQRRRRHEQAVLFTAAAPASPETREAAEAARRMLDGLPEHYRLPVFLRHVAGYSYSELAKALSISEGSARKNVSRGLEQLRTGLSAAGFMVTGVALEHALAQTTLPATSAELTASFHAIATGAHIAPRAAFGALAKTSFSLTPKVLLIVGALLASLAAVAVVQRLTAHPALVAVSQPPLITQGDKPTVPGVLAAASEAGDPPDPALLIALNKTVQPVSFERAYLPEILDTLSHAVSFGYAFPRVLSCTPFAGTSLNMPAQTLHASLDQIAVAFGYYWEAHGTVVYFGRKDDPGQLQQWTEAAAAASAAPGTPLTPAQRAAIFRLGWSGDLRALKPWLMYCSRFSPPPVVRTYLPLDLYSEFHDPGWSYPQRAVCQHFVFEYLQHDPEARLSDAGRKRAARAPRPSVRPYPLSC